MKVATPGGALVAALFSVGVVKLILHYQKNKKKKQKFESVIPNIQVAEGHVTHIERFGEYVVRQIGLDRDTPAARRLARVAEDYLRGDKSHSDSSLENLFDFLTRVCTQTTDDQIHDLINQLIKELDVCTVTYFSFHWNHNSKIIEQVINGGTLKKKKSLKMAVLSATRKQRFQRVLKELNAQRWFANILEMLRAMGKHNATTPDKGTVMIPAHSSVRSPVLLFIGGGMGAGKTTAVQELMQGPFWKSVSKEAVVVAADAFKESDVIYRTISSMNEGRNVSEIAEFVHETSTYAASSLLVTALNGGRDVILDGTMSWEPFVMQTIAMARDVHNKHYHMGPGYVKNSDGTVSESYWEAVEEVEEGAEPRESAVPLQKSENGDVAGGGDDLNLKKPLPVVERKPYRIEFVGVICDAHMAVVRGMRRAILTKRGVPVKQQLRSHKLFTTAIKRYCEVMDYVKIYSTTAMGSPPALIGFKEGAHKMLIDSDEFSLLKDLIDLNVDATSIFELYSRCNKKWHDLVFAPERYASQRLLNQKLSHPNLQHELGEWDAGSNSSYSPPGGSSASPSRQQSSKSTDSTDSSFETGDLGSGPTGVGGSTDEST